MHLHNKADELCMYLSGQGLVGAGDDRLRIGPGYARLMPTSIPHFYHNASVGETSEVFGIYVGAGDVEATGYGYCGKPTAEDLARCEQTPQMQLKYPVVKMTDAPPHEKPDLGWRSTDYRPLLATTNKPLAFCFVATVAPGGSRARHRIGNAETYYLVHGGNGTAGSDGKSAKLRAGHVWWVPAGRETWLRNDSSTEPLKLVGYQVGVAAASDLAYTHVGEAPSN
jgi:mannose-6-phosphate isomerase-like protein (cupin superfamily)